MLRVPLIGTVLLAGAGLGCAGCSASSGGWFEPQGERWTILCLELQGPGSEQSAHNVAETLKHTTGINPKKVRVEVVGSKASIYYGTYYRKVDPATRVRAPSAELDREVTMLRELVDEQGQRYFMGARRVLAPGAAAEHPEWKLANVEAAYTLQVAVYYNDASMHDRRKAALEKCRQLRRKGYQAYYHHDETCSMVTVGAFGPEAVVDESGQVRFVTRSGEQRQVAYRYSDEVVALQRKPECRYNLTNDNIEHNIDHLGRSVPVRTMLVHVPKGDRGP